MPVAHENVWGSTGVVLAIVAVGTAIVQIVLFSLGIINRKHHCSIKSYSWWIGAISIWALTIGILNFLGSLWEKHSAVSIGREAVSALPSSAFLYLCDITEAVPRLYTSVAVFLLGLTLFLIMKLFRKTEPCK